MEALLPARIRSQTTIYSLRVVVVALALVLCSGLVWQEYRQWREVENLEQQLRLRQDWEPSPTGAFTQAMSGLLYILAPLMPLLLLGAVVGLQSASKHRKIAELALDDLRRESAARQSAQCAVDTFFSLSATPIAIVGFDGVAKRLNPAWEGMLGFSLEGMQSRPLLDFIHPGDKQNAEQMFVDLRRGITVVEKELCFISASGQVHCLSWSASILPSEQLIVATIWDVSERKERQRASEKQTDKLVRSNADLERFAFMASHDLQEPLRMVASFAKQLEKHYKGQLDERADRYINYVVDGALRMQAMISALLSYSSLENSQPVFRLISSAESARNALKNLQNSILESNADIQLDSLPDLHADGALLTHLFQNLAGNAIKFCGGSAPKIHISAKQGEQEWIFLVRDEGIGIPREDCTIVFGLFQRLHSKAEYPGSGMGLAICHQIVQRHGGRIWVESELSKGSHFYFSISQKLSAKEATAIC